jgi:hypothetical protein
MPAQRHAGNLTRRSADSRQLGITCRMSESGSNLLVSPTADIEGTCREVREGSKGEILAASRCFPLCPEGGHRQLDRRCPKSAKGRSKRAHSITSSARASSVGGISRLSAFAVLTLMISRNLVGCSTGRSAGLAPFNILST